MNRWNNLIDLKVDSAPMEVINQRILSDATIEGTNLIVLVMAIMIACIGLNLNSVAVIIGALGFIIMAMPYLLGIFVIYCIYSIVSSLLHR